MAELIPTADEAAWLEARRQGITASEIAVVMGLSPWDSPYALFHRKLGILPGITDNAAMERGRVLEPYIAEKFAERHPELMMTGTGRELFRHDGRPWQMATPDRLLCDDMRLDFEGDTVIEEFEPAAVLECKTASDMSEWGEPGTDEIPVHYRAQVLWQMDVMGVATAYVTVLDIPRWRVLEYVVSHAEGCGPGRNMLAYPSLACPACDDIAMMRDAGREFLGRVQRQDAPDVDWRPATAYALKQLHPSLEARNVVVPASLAKKYRAACKAVKAAEKRKSLAENQLRERMGTAQAAYDGASGQVLATRQVYDVAARLIERKAFTVDKLIPAKPKKES